MCYLLRLSAWLLAAGILYGCAGVKPDSPEFYEATTQKPYADVLQELEIAITEENFRITGHNKIGSVIRQREQLDFPDYDTVQFCNLSLARDMLQMSPVSVNWMPCNVAVWREAAAVHISVRLLPVLEGQPELAAFARMMNLKLKHVVDFAAQH